MKNTKWLMIGAVLVLGYLWFKNKPKSTGTSTDITSDTTSDTTSESDDSAIM
jgi:hypothetical protein